MAVAGQWRVQDETGDQQDRRRGGDGQRRQCEGVGACTGGTCSARGVGSCAAGDHDVAGEADPGRDGEQVTGPERRVAVDVGPDDGDESGEGDGEANPELPFWSCVKEEPTAERDADRRDIGEECGHGGAGVENGGVVEGEVEAEGEARERGEDERAARWQPGPPSEPDRDQNGAGNECAVERGRGS